MPYDNKVKVFFCFYSSASNSGVPQGCVPSPFLFTLYTNDCISPLSLTTYIKYSHGTAIRALLSENNPILSYQISISQFAKQRLRNWIFISNTNRTSEYTHPEACSTKTLGHLQAQSSCLPPTNSHMEPS